MAHNLRPFRDYSEHDVINLFALKGANTNGIIANKGTVVKIDGVGFAPIVVGPGGTGSLGSNPVDMAGDVGAHFDNIVSERYAVSAKVVAGTWQNKAVGITLMDVRETDENGEKLVYNPRKASEMNVIVSGQATPVLTKGTVLYSGSEIGSASAGASVYVSATAGELTTTQPDATAAPVGYLLGTAVSNTALLRLSF